MEKKPTDNNISNKENKDNPSNPTPVIKFKGRISLKLHKPLDFGIIQSILFTKNKKLILGCFHYGNILVFIKENNSYELEDELEGHTEGILSLFESKREDFILSAGKDKIIKLWDLLENQCVSSISTGHEGFINQIIETKEGLVISCSEDEIIKVFNSDLKPIGNINGNTSSVNCLIEIKNNILVSGGFDNTLRFFDLKNCLQKETEINNLSPISLIENVPAYKGNSISYQEDKNRLIITGAENCFTVVDCEKFEILRKVNITELNLENCFYFWNILQLRNKNFIFGVFKEQFQMGKMIHLDENLNLIEGVDVLNNYNIYCLCLGEGNEIFIGTDNGFMIYEY